MMFCCLRNCFDGFGFKTPQVKKKEPSLISLDTRHMGHEIAIVKNGARVCGRGGALTTAPIVQNKSYFEVKVLQDGIWAVGLATLETDLNTGIGGLDEESWALNSDCIVRHNGQELHKVQMVVQEGDIIGVTYDHIELNFFVNGEPIEATVLGIKGTVYPVLYVDDGAILDLILDNFVHGPPPGFDKIMLEQSLL